MISFTKAASWLILALAAAVPVRAEGNAKEPFEVVRALRVLQDEVARGDRDAHRAQQQMMAGIPAQLMATPPELWKEPRNLRAAISYVLSGGDPRVLRKLLRLGYAPDSAADLVRGALAHAEGRDDEARALLFSVDALRLDPGLAGAVALAQSALVAEADPVKASELLDQARLLAPGTLVEEAALRRQILLLPSAGQLDRLDLLLARYTRRFGKSYYARTFWRQLAVEVAGLDETEQNEQLTKLEALSATLENEDRGDFYLALAREGLARGKVDLVRLATRQVLQRTSLSATGARRRQVYESAALVLTVDYQQAVRRLAALGRGELAREDAQLVEAALSVARQIHRPPAPVARSVKAEPGIDPDERSLELAGIGLSTISRAWTLVTTVDALLSGKAE